MSAAETNRLALTTDRFDHILHVGNVSAIAAAETRSMQNLVGNFSAYESLIQLI